MRVIYYRNIMKLSDYAKKNKCTNRTAWTHFKKGLIDGAYKTPSGRIIIPDTPLNAVVILFSGSVEDLISKLK